MTSLREYQPVFVVVLLALIFALITSMTPAFHVHVLMNHFMGFFLCLFAMFKLFDVPGFADGFQMYDVIAKKIRAYGLLYPFIELGLGIAYLASVQPFFTNVITAILMSVSALGVFKSLRAGMNVRCACLGTVLKVPLSTVSVVENCSMVIMALANLVFMR